MKKALQTILAGLQLLIFVCVADPEFLNILKFKLGVSDFPKKQQAYFGLVVVLLLMEIVYLFLFVRKCKRFIALLLLIMVYYQINILGNVSVPFAGIIPIGALLLVTRLGEILYLTKTSEKVPARERALGMLITTTSSDFILTYITYISG